MKGKILVIITIFICVCGAMKSDAQKGYCTPSYTSGCSGTRAIDIDTFQLTGALGTSIIDNGTGCSTGSFDNRTSESVKVIQGKSYSGYITTEHSDTNHVLVWIDFNDDRIFSSSEIVDSIDLVNVLNATFTIAIPSTAPMGSHRMRVRLVKDTLSYASIDPCSNYDSGETHDYTVIVESPTATPTIAKVFPDTLCETSTLILKASSTTTPPVTYTWTKPDGTTVSGATITVSNITLSEAGSYSVTATSGGFISAPAYDTVVVKPTPGTVITVDTAFCSGNTISFTLPSTTAPGVTYAWTGPGGYTSSKQDPTITNADTSATGTYTVLARSTDGCASKHSANIVVHLTPKIANLVGVNPTACNTSNGSFILSGLLPNSTFTINYTMNGATVPPVTVTSDAGGNATVTGLTTGIYGDITATYFECVSNVVGPVTLTAPASPATPGVNHNTPVCFDGVLNLTATGGSATAKYIWTGPSGFSSTSATPTIDSVTFADSGIYYVHYIDTATGCVSLPDSTDVSINQLPQNPVLSSNSPVCLNSTLTLSATSTTKKTTFTWTGPAGFTGVTADTSINNVTMANGGEYYVFAVSPNGCASAYPDSVDVVVKPLPAPPSAGNNTPICSGVGNEIDLTATSRTRRVSYVWTGPNGFSSTSSNPVIFDPPLADSGTYTVYSKLNGCLSATPGTTKVIIKATPNPPNVTNYEYCQNVPTVALQATGVSLLWYNVPSGGSGTAVPPIPVDTAPGTFTWYVTQTDTDGCTSQEATQTVVVNPIPDAPYTATAAYTYCQFEAASILTAVGQNLLWYNSATGGAGDPIAPTPSTLTPGTYTFYVSQTIHGCEGPRLPITVTVIAKPPAPLVTTPVYYCQNDVATPLSEPVTSGKILWYEAASGGVASTTPPTPLTTYPNDTINYYASQVVNGCESDRSLVQVIIKPKPNAIIIGSAPYVCQFDTMSFTYFGNATASASYEWTVPTGGSVISGSGQGPIVIRFDSSGNQLLTLSVQTDGCSSPIAKYTVDVRKAPFVPIVMPKDACMNQIVPIQTGTSNDTISNYIWNFDGGSVVYGSTGPGPYGVTYNNQGTYVVSLKAITNKCPSPLILDTINIHPQGDAFIAHISNSNPCVGDSVEFSVEQFNPAYQYSWSPGEFFGTENNKGDVFGIVNLMGYVHLQVTTDYGCVSMDSTFINAHPCCDMFFPNAFSPNGDAKNDVFSPLPGQSQREIKRFVVYDRWGQEMFETNEQNKGWDGKHNGVPQDIGTYYYLMQYICADGKTYKKEGEVILVK